MSDSDLTYTSNGFIMPDHDVTISLIFMRPRGIVLYYLLGDIIPKEMELPKSTMDLPVDYGNEMQEFLEYTGAYGLSLHYYGDTVSLKNNNKSTLCRKTQRIEWQSRQKKCEQNYLNL